MKIPKFKTIDELIDFCDTYCCRFEDVAKGIYKPVCKKTNSKEANRILVNFCEMIDLNNRR